MKNKYRIVFIGRGIITKGIYLMLSRVGHIVTVLKSDELSSASFDLNNLPQLFLIAAMKFERGGIGTAEMLKAKYSEIPVMIMLFEDNVPDTIRAIKAGVNGYGLFSLEQKELNLAVNIIVGRRDYFFDLTTERLVYSAKDDIFNLKKASGGHASCTAPETVVITANRGAVLS